METADTTTSFLWCTAILALGGAAFCVGVRLQIRAVIGQARHATYSARRMRLALTLATVVASIALLELDSAARLPAALVLVGGLAITWVRPGFDDHVFGSEGVRRGWFARRFADVEEWRLTGEHLRWRLYGVWLATEVPAEHHAELRAQLEELVPDRESRFAR